MDIQKEREAFESAMQELSGGQTKNDVNPVTGEYQYGVMQVMWSVWQKAQAVPEVITIGNELQSWVAVWSFMAKNDGEDYVVVDANLLAKNIEKLTGAKG